MTNTDVNDKVSVDIYFDYLCPYVYNAAIWLQTVQVNMGSKLNINWKYFSLEQVNSEQGPNWKIWEQPVTYSSRGLRAFWAAEAARLQGEQAFDSFHLALLRAKHEQNRDIADIATLIEMAEGVDLELTQFQNDITNRKLLARLAGDHTFASDTLGIFGTPTFVFPEEQAVFLKLSQPPVLRESLSVFAELQHLAERRTYIQEIKRPRRPSLG